MGRNATSFKPGQSGNPKGRPPKERALTEILERAGKTTVEVEGKKISGQRLVAHLAWELATTGQVALPNGVVLEAELDDWLNAVKWLYAQIDGPPKQGLEVTGPDGEGLFPIDKLIAALREVDASDER
jgi:hypothetical protein